MLYVAGIANLLRVGGVEAGERRSLSRGQCYSARRPHAIGSPRHGAPLVGASLPELPFAGERRQRRSRSAPSPVGRRSRPAPTSGPVSSVAEGVTRRSRRPNRRCPPPTRRPSPAPPPPPPQ